MDSLNLTIAHIITDGNIGGAQQHCLYMIKYISNTNCKQVLIVGNDGFLSESARKLGVNVMVLPSMRNTFHPFPLLRGAFDVKRFLKSNSVDLLHIHSSTAGVVGRIGGFLSNVKNIFSVHGWSFNGQRSLLRKYITIFVEILLAPLTDCYVFETTADSHIAMKIPFINKVKSRLIPNGVVVRSKKRPPFCNHLVKFVMVARFTDQKAQEDAVLAFRKLNNIPSELHFIGDGPRLDYVKSICEHDDRIHFHGAAVNAMDKITDYDCFVLLSHYEGVPISLLQAMAAGLPSICYEVGGIPEVLTADVGFCIEHGDINAVSRAMTEIVSNVHSRFKFGDRAFDLIENKYSLNVMTSSFGSLYCQLGKEGSQL